MPCAVTLGRCLQSADFGYLLPTLARLPLGAGERLSKYRGILHGLIDYDWRSLALGRCYVRRNTYLAMQMMLPAADRRQWWITTLKRFVNNSREEWQACLFEQDVMRRIHRNCTIEGLESLLEVRRQGRGLMLVSVHFDSFCMGMVLLGMSGLTTHVVNTAMIEDPRIHPTVRNFFQRKYRAMETRMGGRMVYHQVDLTFFYRALERSETVVLLGDIPGGRSTAYIPFMGRRLRMPLGAWQMARKTGSALGAFVCVHEGVGKYRIVCLPPSDPDPDDPVKSMQPIYAFLESWIRKAPQRWVAAELLPTYDPLI